MEEERFLDALGVQAEREMAQITAGAAEEAVRIRDEAVREAGGRSGERLRLAESEARAVYSRIVNAARLEARKTVLSALHDLVEDAVERLQAASLDLRRREDYRRIVERLLDECGPAPGSRVLCSREDCDLVKSIVADRHPDLCVEEHGDSGVGIIVISADGTFIQRNTFAERIRRARPRITVAVAARALPGGEEV